ncbi:hypothetical protein J6590_047348 [Homalodisca vitripennis]|nr:hypothetical protein J6590_047348 [Homalodisca vitripennis]
MLIFPTLGLDMTKLVGQGYDGCSTFSRHITDVHQIFQHLYPKAIYIHCTSQVKYGCDSLIVPCVGNCPGIVNDYQTFLAVENYGVVNGSVAKERCNGVGGCTVQHYKHAERIDHRRNIDSRCLVLKFTRFAQSQARVDRSAPQLVNSVQRIPARSKLRSPTPPPDLPQLQGSQLLAAVCRLFLAHSVLPPPPTRKSFNDCNCNPPSSAHWHYTYITSPLHIPARSLPARFADIGERLGDVMSAARPMTSSCPVYGLPPPAHRTGFRESTAEISLTRVGLLESLLCGSE